MLSTASSASLVVMVDDGQSKVSVMKPKTMTMATMMVRVKAMMRATGIVMILMVATPLRMTMAMTNGDVHGG